MILVTGGTGLVGSHLLLSLINSGGKIRAIHRKNSDFSGVKRVFSYGRSKEEADQLFKEIEWTEGNIIDIPSLEKAFAGVTKVYHCAALVSFDPSRLKDLRKVNIEGTDNVVNLSIKNKIEKLCFTSSIATLDKKLNEETITEKSSWNKEKDHSFYAITKYGAEMEIWRASQEGIPVVIVNPGVIIGSGFWNSGSGLIFKKVNNGLRFYFPKVTGFVGVDDVVRAMIILMQDQLKNEQVILVSENRSFKSIFEEVAGILNKPAPSFKLQPWMVRLGWIAQKFLSYFMKKERKLTRLTIKSLYSVSYYSSEKVKSEFNFQFEDINSVIKKTGNYFKEDHT